MLILGTFFNNIVNKLIRNLDEPVQIIISLIFFVVGLMSLYYAIKNQPKDKPGFRMGWLILSILSITISVLYLVL